MSAVPPVDRSELALPGCALHYIAGPVGELALHRPLTQGPSGELGGAGDGAGAVSALPADAPVVLLVHSINAAACAAEMSPLMERLQTHCRVYALDLPGYGASARPARVYDIPIFVDAIGAAVQALGAWHGKTDAQGLQSLPGVHVLALSLSCEFAARLARTCPDRVSSLGLISPTGLDRRSDALRGLEGATREVPGMLAILGMPLLRDALFCALVSRPSMRYFLRRTWGAREIDETLLQACWLSAHQPDAVHAPLSFLSGKLFARDIRTVYEALQCPVWMAHGTRGDFKDYSGADWTRTRPRWHTEVFEAGALPQFEHPDALARSYLEFLAR